MWIRWNNASTACTVLKYSVKDLKNKWRRLRRTSTWSLSPLQCFMHTDTDRFQAHWWFYSNSLIYMLMLQFLIWRSYQEEKQTGETSSIKKKNLKTAPLNIYRYSSIQSDGSVFEALLLYVPLSVSPLWQRICVVWKKKKQVFKKAWVFSEIFVNRSAWHIAGSNG